MENIKDKYFSRATTYNVFETGLEIYDRKRPRVITVDEWSEVVFYAANGQGTVKKFIDYLLNEYPNISADKLKKAIISRIKGMHRNGFIKLSDHPVQLPPYLDKPLFEQDPEVYRKQMLDDGFIKE